MKDLILTMPWLASFCSVVCLAKALRFFDVRHAANENHRARLVVLLASMVMMPSLARAAAADLKTAVEAGNATRKLGLHQKGELVRYAVQHGFPAFM